MEIYKKYWNKYRVSFIFAASCVFFEAICDLLQPTIMAHLIDSGVKNSRLDYVLSLGGLMLFIACIGACFASTRNILASKVSQNFGAELRMDLFTKVTKFSLSSVDKIESGSLITRLTNDVTQVTQFANGMMRIFLKAPLSCIGGIIMAILLNPSLSIILLIAVAIVAILIIFSMKLSYPRYIKVQKAMDRVNTVMQEYLLGVRLVKAFGRFSHEEERFDSSNSDLSLKSASAQRVMAIFAPFMTLVINIGIASVLYVGSMLFIHKNVEIGKIIAFTNYMTQILGSLMMISNVFNTFVRTTASTQRIQEIFDQEESSETHTADYSNISADGIVFEDVTFAYPNSSGVPVLKNISFICKKGETLGVIAPTGSGKSTLASLLLRFYDATSGSIYLNGENVNSMSQHVLREKISIAPQVSMLFSGTILENIKWGNDNATQEIIDRAAKVAQAESFINATPQKYDSVLGQNGVNLSGGQKQRISITRALVKNPQFIVLDDCTSALDAVTEAKVRSGLLDYSDSQTVVLITQRIGTAMSADKILVLENGEVVGFGKHEELMKSCSTYIDIYPSQIGKEGE